MDNTLRSKIISYGILFCILLNISLYSITLNSGFNLSVTFSCVSGTITYSYNPIEFTKGLKDNLLDRLYKNSDKQNKKENKKSGEGDKRDNFIIALVSFYQIKIVKQFNDFDYEKSFIKDRYRSSKNNLHIKFLHNSPELSSFYFILLVWFAIIFRRRRDLLNNMVFCKKNI